MLNFDYAKEYLINPRVIIEIIARINNVSETLLLKKTKIKEVVTMRKYGAYFMRKYCKRLSLLEISEYLGYQSEGSHATVLYHYEDVIEKMPIYDDVRNEVEKIEAEIKKYVDSSIMMRGYTVLDAIQNPQILDAYKKEGQGKSLPYPKD